MSLKSILILILASILILTAALLYGLERFVESHILTLLQPADAVTVAVSLHLLLVEQAGVLFLFALAVTLASYFIQRATFFKPLQRLIRTVNEFSLDNTRIDTSAFRNSANDIRALAEAFTQFEDKVELVHKKDVEVSRVKSDFISTAAHQLRTPLTGIRWALEALEKERLNATQDALVKNAIEKSHDLVAIVGTLLDISSIESGKYKYNFELAKLEPIIEGVAQDFAEMARTGGVTFYYEKSEGELPSARIDHDRVKWVLNNIVENALRYTPSGGTVSLSTQVVANKIFVRIRDTGIGIPSNDRSNIFQRFYRASNAVTKQQQGNGLGLYIARTIATDHGGDLTFEANTEGPGTTFVLSLPVAG